MGKSSVQNGDREAHRGACSMRSYAAAAAAAGPLAPPPLHFYDTVRTNHIAPLLFLTSMLANHRTRSYIRIEFIPISVR